jgi:hypothetical protein
MDTKAVRRMLEQPHYITIDPVRYPMALESTRRLDEYVVQSALKKAQEAELEAFRHIRDEELYPPALLRALVGNTIKSEGSEELRKAWRAATHERERGVKTRKRETMRTTMSQPQALEGLNRLISQGILSARIRPRTWSNHFFAIEVDVPREGVYSFPSAIDGKRRYWDSIAGVYSETPPIETVKLISLDHVDDFLTKRHPKPIVCTGKFVGNNSFQFVLADGTVLAGPKKETWTLAEIRNAGGETHRNGQTYILNPPDNLFNQGSSKSS